jgi:prepilin-type N-terminal cleavage/methylation domain-containing protein
VTRFHDRVHGDGGFSLVEMMVATAILGLVLLIVYGTLNTGVQQAVDTQSRAQIEAQVRLASDELVRDLRQAYTGDPSLNTIGTMTGTTLTFYSPDRSTPFHLRKISYRVNGTTLERSVTPSTDTDGFPWTFGTTGAYVPVITDVRNTTLFTYVDQDGNATTDPTGVFGVTFAVTVDHDTTRGPGAVSYTTTAEIRGVAE